MLCINTSLASRLESESEIVNIEYLNKLALEEYWGGNFKVEFCRYFSPFNKMKVSERKVFKIKYSKGISFDNDFEYGRFAPTEFYIKRKLENQEENLWFIADWDWVKTNDCDDDFELSLNAFATYSSLGLDKKEEIVSELRKIAEDVDVEFDEKWIPTFTKEKEKMIRSLSQTFSWSKEYIIKNEDILDLDVLGLNMSVPWDMELVKFFIDRGYGGRMSENKAVFDKVFDQLLTDDILDKLFKCEYEKYE